MYVVCRLVLWALRVSQSGVLPNVVSHHSQGAFAQQWETWLAKEESLERILGSVWRFAGCSFHEGCCCRQVQVGKQASNISQDVGVTQIWDIPSDLPTWKWSELHLQLYSDLVFPVAMPSRNPCVSDSQTCRSPLLWTLHVKTRKLLCGLVANMVLRKTRLSANISLIHVGFPNGKAFQPGTSCVQWRSRGGSPFPDHPCIPSMSSLKALPHHLN